MVFSRRDVCRLLPQLTALVGSTATKGFAAEDSTLSSKAYRFEDLPVHRSAQNASRPVLEGETHSGCHIEMHESASSRVECRTRRTTTSTRKCSWCAKARWKSPLPVALPAWVQVRRPSWPRTTSTAFAT